MTQLNHARSFRDLVVYQKARRVAKDMFELTKEFPKEERDSLTDQVRRSSRSVGAQIAEAWAKRRYERHFVSKLTDADGEQQETHHWVESACDCGYREHGLWGAVARTNSGPEDPVWHEFPERLQRMNGVFAGEYE